MATDTVVLSDTQGNYYLLSNELIEQAKVTDPKQKAELEQSIQGGDTAGFTNFAATYQPFSLGASQFKAIGACACNFSFGRGGTLSY